MFLLWGVVLCQSLVQKDVDMCHGVDIREISIAKVHERYWDGTLTPGRLTACYLDRILALNPALGAVVSINPLALTKATELDQLGDDRFRLKLFGIPVLVNDNIAAEGMQTTAGSLMLYDFLPKSDALVVERLLEQGAIILGKANLSEMAG
ncbi:hypothetical protein DSO57_1021991 [Entomophthora muscae]|uniref:Uncharacterized protein n=1 Tax=Entomophthora muscae TaxID=34485 RepID=A0ACC2T367_9FUNG|nr:hypothetical protein DSO57_1021991 [Entomophthora muscae]